VGCLTVAGRARIAVAGAGEAGLACALALAGRASVTVYERLDAPRPVGLARAAADAGVRLVVATQAIRWLGDGVVASGATTGTIAADGLVVATGHRPLTRTECGIGGTRCGGVLAAPVARRLLAGGVVIGREVVVLGREWWNEEDARTLAASGAQSSFVDDVVEIEGMPRISAVAVWRDGRLDRVDCDALVLARGRVPHRTIDGAVLDAPGVVFAQAPAAGPWSPEARGGAAAVEMLSMLEHQPHPRHVPATVRVGPPR
jgi:D-hydroxyproline dehydrogenase subunit alpha